MPNEILNISQLSFAYSSQNKQDKNDSLVISNLSFMLSAGEIVCILGASGCGKSTLLNLIAALLKPKSGNIQIFSKSSTIGYIFQEDALFPGKLLTII